MIKNETSEYIRSDSTNVSELDLDINGSLLQSKYPIEKDNTRSLCVPEVGQKRCLPDSETVKNHTRLPSFSRFNERKEKNYDCEKCNISFSSSMTLQRHNRRIHSGIKPENAMS